MTTEDDDAGARLDRLNANLAKVEELSQRLMAALSTPETGRSGAARSRPGRLHEGRRRLCGRNDAEPGKDPGASGQLLGQDAEALCRGAADAGQGQAQGAARPDAEGPPLLEPAVGNASVLQLPQAAVPAERRSRHECGGQTWTTLDPADRKRVEYFTKQIVDMFSPTNFLGTNPEALEQGGRDGRRKPGAGAGKPGARHRGERGRPAGHAGRPARRSRSARTSPPRRARWSIATGCWS